MSRSEDEVTLRLKNNEILHGYLIPNAVLSSYRETKSKVLTRHFFAVAAEADAAFALLTLF